MTVSIKQAWNATPPAVTSLTVTGLSSLANGADATSNVVDNSSGNFLDGVFEASIQTAASGTSATGYVDIFLQPSLDNSNFPDTSNDLYLDTIQVSANSTTYKKLLSISKVLQGWLPPYFKLRFHNATGGALTAGSVNYNLPYDTVG